MNLKLDDRTVTSNISCSAKYCGKKRIDETFVILDEYLKSILAKTPPEILKKKRQFEENSDLTQEIQIESLNAEIVFSRADIIAELTKLLELGDDFVNRVKQFDERTLLSEHKASKFCLSEKILLNAENTLSTFNLVSKKHTEEVSSRNKRNIYLSLFHHFLVRFIIGVTLPITAEYVTKLSGSVDFVGFYLALCPIGCVLSCFFFMFASNRNYYFSYIISALLLLTSFVCFLAADNANNTSLIAVSRFLLGLGSGRVMNLRYLSEHIPQPRITRTSVTYDIVGKVGLFCGPFICLLESIIPEFTFIVSFNKFRLIGLTGLVASVILFVLVSFMFTNPNSDSFSIFQDDLNNSELENFKKASLIDLSLEKLNEEGSFNHTNIVSEKLNEIVELQRKSIFSYIGKAIFTLLALILFSSLTVELLLVSSPTVFLFNFKRQSEVASFMQSISLAAIIPMSLIFQQTVTNYTERKTIFTLVTVSFVLTMLLTCYLYCSELFYYTVFFLLLNIAFVLESLARDVFARVLPKSINRGLSSASFLIILLSEIGKTFGSLLFAFSMLINRNYVNQISFVGASVVALSVLVVVVRNFSDLKVKALARIMKLIK